MSRTLFDRNSGNSFEQTLEELEVSILKGKILNVLDRAIARTQVAMCLPMLVEDCSYLLPRYFSSDEIDELMMCSKLGTVAEPADRLAAKVQPSLDAILTGDHEYARDQIRLFQDDNAAYQPPQEMTHSLTTLKEAAAMGYSNVQLPVILSYPEEKEDPIVSRAIDILCSNNHMVAFINENLIRGITPAAHIFIEYLTEFRHIAEELFSVTPNQKQKEDELLQKVWNHNENMKEEIETLSDSLRVLKSKMADDDSTLDEIESMYEQQIEKLRRKNHDAIKKLIMESQVKMSYKYFTGNQKLEYLRGEYDGLRSEYKTLKSKHMGREKKKRAKKSRMETKLLSLLKKYDSDMAARQEEIDRITEVLDEELKTLNAMKKEFDLQQEEYDMIMEEKEIHERQIFEEKVFAFLMNRAARRIQRCWRAYRARKMERRKAQRAKRHAKARKIKDKKSKK